MKKDITFPPLQRLEVKRYARIAATGIGLPERVVTNQDIIDRHDLFATDRAVQYSLGIKERRWAEADETLAQLLARATRQCLDRANLRIEEVDRVIFSKL